MKIHGNKYKVCHIFRGASWDDMGFTSNEDRKPVSDPGPLKQETRPLSLPITFTSLISIQSIERPSINSVSVVMQGKRAITCSFKDNTY